MGQSRLNATPKHVYSCKHWLSDACSNIVAGRYLAFLGHDLSCIFAVDCALVAYMRARAFCNQHKFTCSEK